MATISYEHPLSERVRTLLRLEDLFERARYFIAKTDAQEHHVALLRLFEILDMTGRADIKSDLLQELERQKQTLEALRNNPDIAQDALDGVLWEIDRASSQLFQMPGKIGQSLRENDWLMSIKNRANIPGGACEFDLPSYHCWLHGDAEHRRQDLELWFAPFQPIVDGIAIVLRLLRQSGKTTTQTAVHGVYQQVLAGRVAQILRVELNRNCRCVPEISANKYALNIRFVAQQESQRPKTVESDVEFELTFCSL